MSNFVKNYIEMQQVTLSGKTEWLIHIIFWVLAAYLTFIGNPFQASFSVPDLFIITYLVTFIITFYFHYLMVMNRVFKVFSWQKLVAGIFITFLFFTACRWLAEQYFTDILFGRTNYTNPNLLNYLVDNLSYSSKPIIYSSFLWFVIYFIRLMEYNHQILEENKNTEIRFLKAQINPHFVFNTLNNIYSMVYFQSDKSLPAIEKLSHIMRFTTYDAQKEKILLSDEVNYIKAYIELEQFRHEDDAFVVFDQQILNEKIEIPPYILSPLVENAMKHGIASNTNPILITLHSDHEMLSFKVENGIGTQKKDKLGGIGLDNLQKRLDIHYPKSHTLTISKNDNRFTAALQIDLK
ncbi:sensor histidine kinase [Polluticaenibacter yanchengensis]|uniref:Histidine kinase n=1 Tax=Polluticaenibacter yanchengensis TaxID=3014562 RepID=A0ABT4UP14_9BACT|nr:histidine kinase [Chitinophagaceae bacterium LY-5]